MADQKYMDFYTKSEINAMLNGLSFIKMSKEDYEALPSYDSDTIYYVYDEKGKITQYMGDVDISGGTVQITTFTALQSGTTGSISGISDYI